MDYVTVEGVKLRTGYDNKKHWYLLCIKELLDNCIDFLWKYYRGATDAAIDVRIEKTSDLLLHIKIRNTNNKNVPVFENLEPIFNYEYVYQLRSNFAAPEKLSLP
jgi:hypothetical protein